MSLEIHIRLSESRVKFLRSTRPLEARRLPALQEGDFVENSGISQLNAQLSTPSKNTQFPRL
jgi:hypothetical protein